VVGLFIGLWTFLWLIRIPMPRPFLAVLLIEAAFYVAYLYALPFLPNRRALKYSYYVTLAAEIVFHTTIVYFLGGITWLGAFAYMFGLIFTNTFLDLKRGFIYTACASAAFSALIVLDATGTIPHYSYMAQGPLRYQDSRVVMTTLLGGVGVFFSTYVWVNWVGHQVRAERDHAVEMQQQLATTRAGLERANSALEARVRDRTSELEMAVGALSSSERLLRSTIESTADGILVVDSHGKVALANSRFLEMWRIPRDLADGREDDSLLEFVLDQLDDPQAFVEKVRDLYASADESYDTLAFKDGRAFERYSRALVKSGAIEGRVWSFRDVSERKQFESQLLDLANHDPLTGLYNRRRFNQEIESQLAMSRRYGLNFSLLFLDIDQFKDVNDSRGHRAGDDLLVELARILRGSVKDTDVVARFGGDEFALLLPHTHERDALVAAQRLLENVRAHPFEVANAPINVTISVGVASYPAHSVTADELLSCADVAMYEAKELGRNRVAMFSRDLGWKARIESRIAWQQRIREALERDELVLHAQPILDLRTHTITQYELLLRALQVDGTLVLPGVFLPIAERSGLIQDIDRWVVKRAIALLAEAERAGRDITLEVNLSGKAFGDEVLLQVIRQSLADTGIDPSKLVLEVTESVAIANMSEACRFVETLRGLGCQFALDDFGVGFSSFSHLKHLPVDYLKIDGSFIRDLSRSPVDQHLVRAIVDVAQALGKRTIAEFVSDEDSLHLLTSYGVDYAQGFYLAQPDELRITDAGRAA